MIKSSVLNHLGQANNLGLKKRRALLGWCAEQVKSLGRWYLLGAGHVAQALHICLMANSWLHPAAQLAPEDTQQHRTPAEARCPNTSHTGILWRKKSFGNPGKGSSKGFPVDQRKDSDVYTSSWVLHLGSLPWVPLWGFWQVSWGGV